MDLGKKIKLLRLERSITQEQLAKKMNVTPQAVCKWENGNTMPDIVLLPQLSAFFGVTIDELFELTDETHIERIRNMLENQTSINEADFTYAERFLTRHMGNVAVEKLLARLYNFRAREYHYKAQQCVKQVIKYNPHDKESHSLLCEAANGVCWDWIVENHNDLIGYYYQLLKENPDASIAYVFLIEMLVADMRLQEAEMMLNQFKEITESPYYLRLRGYIELKKGNLQEAEIAWEEMTTRYSDNWKAWSYRADAYAKLAQYDTAIDFYKKSASLQESPRLIDNYLALANIYEMKKDYDNVIKAYNEIVDILINEFDLSADGDAICGYKDKIHELSIRA